MALIGYRTSEGEVFARKAASPDGRYFALWTYDAICCGKREPGRVWVFGPGGELFSPAKTVRPTEIAVADGRVAIYDTAGPEYKTRVVDVDAGTIARKLPLTDHAELLSSEIPMRCSEPRPILQTPDSPSAE